MMLKRLSESFVARNLLGLLALLLAHYLPDQYLLSGRDGFERYAPYFYLVLMYGWLILHNRVLFEGMFLKGRTGRYFGWLAGLVGLQSLNMYLILRYQFGVSHVLPFLISFYVYTVTGLGVYMTFRFLTSPPPAPPAANTGSEKSGPAVFGCQVDGSRLEIPYADILYLESLENYLKVVTRSRTHVTRMTMKEAEERLPRDRFVRISRSHIVQADLIRRSDPNVVEIGGRAFRVGRVYKRYVSEYLNRFH
ncbi:LytR/AlgR family response regulator transcription factor [Larkinella soli]|uniref:LytR/AlgR family response regulator transcription factor n=1 Tax=Larkinella soli TaxID=1770527 RepID=UPI000FFB68A1|nr:LytTR family DNA-binding domain-containing protein [Larkinella soli]